MESKCPVDYKSDNCSSKEYGLDCQTCHHILDLKVKYNPPDYNYISCKEFGCCDGMDGSCHYCLHENPYQFEMCSDESWKRSLMSPLSKIPNCTEKQAIEFINNYKSKHHK